MMLQSTSRESLATVLAQADGLIADPAADLVATSSQLADVALALHGQPRLRRLLADPATAPEQRAGLLQRVLAGKVDEAPLALASAVVRQRWSSPSDLFAGLSGVAERLLFGAAERQGALDEVEDELFRFGRILAAEPALATLLDDLSVPLDRRSALLTSIIGGKVSQVSERLLASALATQTAAGVTARVDSLVAAAAAMQQRSNAVVRSAVPLSDAQQSRLATVLSGIYGRQIAVRTQVDPSVLGGLLIRVGDEMIDGSVASRLAAARSALADG